MDINMSFPKFAFHCLPASYNLAKDPTFVLGCKVLPTNMVVFSNFSGNPDSTLGPGEFGVPSSITL